MVGGLPCFNPDHGMARCAVVSATLQSMNKESPQLLARVLNIFVHLLRLLKHMALTIIDVR
jgi:hypothetical protein